MLHNYFLTAWRSLAKSKFNTFVNLLGLTAAFTCSILLFLAVHYELSFDSFHQKANRLFEVYNVSYMPDGDKRSPSMAYPLVSTLKTEIPGVVAATAFMESGAGIRYQNKELDKGISLVDNDFFHMFTFPVIAGDKTDPLASIGNVVLEKSTADALFGSVSPIGKMVQVKVSGVWSALMVSAVIADNPDNSTIRYNVLARMELKGNYSEDKANWNHQDHPVFVELAPGVSQQQAEKELRGTVKKYKLVDDDYVKQKGYHKDSNGDYAALKLAPMPALHFEEAFGGGRATGKPYLYTLMLIAVIVMVIACFNFINLNVARSFTRAKEVGVRKTIGAGKGQIFVQLWMESLILCMASAGVALLLAFALLAPFNQLFSEQLTLGQLAQPAVISTVIAGLLLVSFFAGGYPAWLVARFRVVEVLKGKVAVNRSPILRNGLITFQFVMASLLICSTMVIYRQFEHLRTAPLGFSQESVISIPVKNAGKAAYYITYLRTRLASQPFLLSRR